jgi:hypothetical protein
MAKEKKAHAFEDIVLADINITSQEIINDAKKPITAAEVLEFDFKSTFTKTLDVKDGWASIEMNVSIRPKIAQNKSTKAEAKFIIEYLYISPNLKKFVTENKKDGVFMDADLDEWLMQSAISTSRGLIFDKVRGTFLEGAILPLSPPQP